MQKVFGMTPSSRDAVTHYCPGCHHGIIHRLVAEAIDELGVQNKTILVSSIGCSVLSYDYFNLDCVAALHGRAPAVATGLKRSQPDKVIFTYQGDGDLAAIGTAEIMHAAARNEKITVIFVNNTIYGMTGGQMAPTTIPGQVTQTTPAGRSVERNGNPLKMCEIMAAMDGPVYLERVAVSSSKHIMAAKKAIKKAFENQINGLGFSMIEVLSTCPTNWRMTPVQSSKHVQDVLIPFYPLGVYKDLTKGGAA
ncbi:thiamine pyrophosphate-dependent enzyme [Desulfovibrio sp. OttesenSCG-928-C14]|nr:thiamine pyrophosphate-dependent enzyme [Desulfovibrio sp. OttesenSCG-928-C14]